MICICDIHCHILPHMDDGCADVAQTLQVLENAREQGVSHFVATPHFYAEKESVSTFLQRRKASYELLQPHLTEDVQLCLGAEVAYYDGISRLADLDKLCLGQSRFLLLELPFTPWNTTLFRQLQNLICIEGITPILAHIERYTAFQPKSAMQQILELGVPIQMNAEHLLRFSSSYGARQLLKNGSVQLLASDCHDPYLRGYNLGKAVLHLEKHKMHRQLQDAAALSMEIFEKAFNGESSQKR